MDVSGDENKTNFEYLGLVLGSNESIIGLSSKLGDLPEHMSYLSFNEKQHVYETLKFDRINRIAFCVKLDRKNIIEKIRQSGKIKQRTPKQTLLNVYNRVIITHIISYIEEFLHLHGVSIHDLNIQCDMDCKPFVRAGSMKFQHKGAAYRISDYVAWCNNRSGVLQDVIEINFTDKIIPNMLKILGR